MPTRQTSSSGRPKSPRIQVVLPEDLCQRLSVLADDESRTVSNMAKVLIQQGVERLERARQQEGQAAPAAAEAAIPVAPLPSPSLPTPASSPTNPGLSAPAATAPPATAAPAPAPQPPAPPPAPALLDGAGSGPVPGAEAAADRFRAELERNEARGPRRLRGVPRRLRLRPPGG